MQTIIRVSLLLAALAISSALRAQLAQTNAETDPLAITNSAAEGPDKILPLIQFVDVPITTAIENLTRQGEINYIIDPKLTRITGSEKAGIPEPLLTFRITNVTARDTLNRMLNLRQAVMIEDPVTHVARIASTGQATNVVDMSLLNMATNNSTYFTNGIIPLIQFQEVPLDLVFKTLIQQSEVAIEVDPRLSDPTDPVYGGIVLSLRWENVTAKQALVALCLNYDLVIVKDGATGEIKIKPKPDVKKQT